MDRYAVKRSGLRLLRLSLYAVALLAVAGVAAALLGFLGVVTLLGTASALLDAGTPALLLAGGVGLFGAALAGLVAYGLVRLARRLDDELVAAAGPLDRLSALQARYVRDEVDEREFEAELASLLDDRTDARDRPRTGTRVPAEAPPDRDGGLELAEER